MINPYMPTEEDLEEAMSIIEDAADEGWSVDEIILRTELAYKDAVIRRLASME